LSIVRPQQRRASPRSGTSFPIPGPVFQPVIQENTMPQEIMTIGSSPCEESCAQVGNADYDDRSRRECRVFQRMLERAFPLAEDVRARFVVKSSPHDFGSYREVCIRYEDTDPRACEHAYRVEANTPPEWDAIARYELLWLERQEQLQLAVRRGELQPHEVPAPYRAVDFPRLPADRSFAQLLAEWPL
jgi:hypothetical protein